MESTGFQTSNNREVLFSILVEFSMYFKVYFIFGFSKKLHFFLKLKWTKSRAANWNVKKRGVVTSRTERVEGVDAVRWGRRDAYLIATVAAIDNADQLFNPL